MQFVKDNFYNDFQKLENYKDLHIKRNSITTDLKQIFYSNVWDLKNKCEELKKSNKAENKDYYNAFLNDIYLLDYKEKPKIKTIKTDDFLNFKYNENVDNTRNEANYISHFNTWLNLFFPEQVGQKNLNWFVFNQNKVLLTLLNGRNERNNKLETVRKDINLILHFLEIAAAPKEIITKYKLINKNLSLIHEQKESENKLDDDEQKKFIDYKELLKIRNDLYNDWVESYENLTIKNRKDINTRNKNIKALLLSFYSLFPPLRNEGLNLKIVNSHEEAKKGDYNIYIKDLNNIWVYLNKSIKFHKPIHFNINDEIIKSYSKDNVELLILNIIESVKLYPRQYLFINNKGEPYTEKGLQKMLYELVPDKNIGVNALRSIYTSYYLPKLNKNQINRISFLMRTSFNMLSTNYLKKNEEDEITNIINNNNVQTTKPDNTQQKPTQQAPRDRKQYLNDYYEKNKQKIKEQVKNNEKEKTYKIRLLREINNGLINISTVRASTLEKYNIKFDEKSNKYISE
jgi:hypothetical protein